MTHIDITSMDKLGEYARHLKNLPTECKFTRFGYNISDDTIDKFILDMIYNPDNHVLWTAQQDGQIVGWGHMARDTAEEWELAVSVDAQHQNQGIGSRLITQMLEWAKFTSIVKVYMHCISSNKVIQHLALKHKLRTVEREAGEQTAAIAVPAPDLIEITRHKMEQQRELMSDITRAYKQMVNLWNVVPQTTSTKV